MQKHFNIICHIFHSVLCDARCHLSLRVPGECTGRCIAHGWRFERSLRPKQKSFTSWPRAKSSEQLNGGEKLKKLAVSKNDIFTQIKTTSWCFLGVGAEEHLQHRGGSPPKDTFIEGGSIDCSSWESTTTSPMGMAYIGMVRPTYEKKPSRT